MKRFAILATMLALTFAAWAETFTIYVSDQTGWSTFDLYAWGDSEAFGKWPGATDSEIDHRVYELYDLTPEEIRIVEQQ